MSDIINDKYTKVGSFFKAFIPDSDYKTMDGKKVPVTVGGKVVGHALLEVRDNGIIVFGKFDETAEGEEARKLTLIGLFNHGALSFGLISNETPSPASVKLIEEDNNV